MSDRLYFVLSNESSNKKTLFDDFDWSVEGSSKIIVVFYFSVPKCTGDMSFKFIQFDVFALVNRRFCSMNEKNLYFKDESNKM
jgi:hypothetical protein